MIQEESKKKYMIDGTRIDIPSQTMKSSITNEISKI